MSNTETSCSPYFMMNKVVELFQYFEKKMALEGVRHPMPTIC